MKLKEKNNNELSAFHVLYSIQAILIETPKAIRADTLPTESTSYT